MTRKEKLLFSIITQRYAERKGSIKDLNTFDFIKHLEIEKCKHEIDTYQLMLRKNRNSDYWIDLEEGTPKPKVIRLTLYTAYWRDLVKELLPESELVFARPIFRKRNNHYDLANVKVSIPESVFTDVQAIQNNK